MIYVDRYVHGSINIVPGRQSFVHRHRHNQRAADDCNLEGGEREEGEEFAFYVLLLSPSVSFGRDD